MGQVRGLTGARSLGSILESLGRQGELGTNISAQIQPWWDLAQPLN